MRAEAQAHVDQIRSALDLLRRFLDWDRALRRLDEAIGATRAIERELNDTIELIEMAEAEGDDALIDDAVMSLAALAERAERDKVMALLAGEADANDA